MPLGQQGPKTVDTLGETYPLKKMDDSYQAETKNPYGFKILSEGGNGPTISLQTKQSGKIGDASSQSGSPLRSAISEPTQSNPEMNQHDQYVKPDQIEHSPGAFNR